MRLPRINKQSPDPRLREQGLLCLDRRTGNVAIGVVSGMAVPPLDGPPSPGGLFLHAGPGGTISSFPTGMEELVEALVKAFGTQRIRFNSSVDEIVPVTTDAGRKVAVVLLESGERIEADAMIVTTPASATARFFRNSDPEMADPLAEIPFASIAVVVTGHRREDLEHPLDGFGFLFPRSEGRRSLGTLWPASTFPGRAPKGHVLLRTMIGGATDPNAVDLEDRALRQSEKGLHLFTIPSGEMGV